MVQVATLLRTDDGDFVELDEASDVRGGRDHVEGCLVLQAEGKRLLGAAEWTDVDWLWAFLLDGIEALAARRSFETAFPDMPITVRFEIVERHAHRDLVKIQVDERSATVSRLELLDALVEAGLDFHEHLARLVPTRAGAADLARSRLVKHERPEASARIGDLRVPNGTCAEVLDYLVAHAVHVAPALGDRLLDAEGGATLRRWREADGARVQLQELVGVLGGSAPLRQLLELHDPSLDEVAADASARRRLVRVLQRLLEEVRQSRAGAP